MSDTIATNIEDPEEVNILRAINRGELIADNVDWKPYLSNIVKMIGLMKNPISYIGCAWALLQEVDDFSRRTDILRNWQDVAPMCFPTKEASDSFYADAECLIMVNIYLRGLVLMQGAQMPHTYDRVDGGKGLNEMAMLWSDRYVEGKDLVALAIEIHNTVSSGEKDPIIEYFLYANRNYNKLPFDNIYDFSRNLFLAESFRQYLVTGKMYTSEPLAFTDIKRKLRNACYEEYIRLRLAQIETEMEDDNSLLLDPTIDDLYEELYKQESSVVNREQMFEDFRGSQAYHDRWYRGRPEVLQMIQYFIDYLDWKMANIQDKNVRTNNTQVINGDYVAGNKIMGDVIGNVEAGGIGKQVVYGVPPTNKNTAATENKTKPQTPTPQNECAEDLFRYIHYAVIDDTEKVSIHKQICNIVLYPKMSLVCAALKELKSDKKILSTIEPAAMLAELRRLGLPSDLKGFSDQNFFSSYNK